MELPLHQLKQCAASIAVVTWLLMHRIVMSQGFVLRKRGFSTDTVISMVIGATSTFWLTAVIWDVLQTFHTSSDEARIFQHTLQLAAKLVEAPMLIHALFLFWLASWIDGVIAEGRQRKAHLWSLVGLHGPFDWASGVHPGFFWALTTTIVTAMTIPALAALTYGDTLSGALNLAAAFLFCFQGTNDNPYVSASHLYAEDRLRIALPTSHHEGTVYILPGPTVGLDAVWAPKIVNEHLEADNEIMTLFRHMRSGKWAESEPLERLRTTMASFHKKVLISPAHLMHLARWIYVENEDSDDTTRYRKFACERAAGVHLIGRDLMYALCHAEYLVFMGQGRLPPSVQRKLGSLRLMGRSGAGLGDDKDISTIGYKPGLEGYREAVKHVYSIFGEQVDEQAVNFEATPPPKYSSCLKIEPTTIDQYVAELWDKSCENSESTFSALYFFTTVWFIELGNVNGFHIFPVRCKNRNGDLASQQMVWRQVWYSGMIAQLVALSRRAFMLFVLDYLS